MSTRLAELGQNNETFFGGGGTTFFLVDWSPHDQGPHSQCPQMEILKFLQNFRLRNNVLKSYFQLKFHFLSAIVLKTWH